MKNQRELQSIYKNHQSYSKGSRIIGKNNKSSSALGAYRDSGTSVSLYQENFLGIQKQERASPGGTNQRDSTMQKQIEKL